MAIKKFKELWSKHKTITEIETNENNMKKLVKQIYYTIRENKKQRISRTGSFSNSYSCSITPSTQISKTKNHQSS